MLDSLAMDLWAALLALSSYLAGGIPTGYLIAKRLKGIDIREHGSGNPGAANVYRVVGKGAGIATLLVDALKGFLPVLAARSWYPDRHGVLVLCGSLAILGHVWTIFLGFRGGKAVATSAGVFAALLPKPLAATLLAFAAGTALTGHISVGSMSAAAAFPVLAFAFGSPAPLLLMACCACGLILARHIPNLRRLLQGKELLFRNRTRLENDGEKQ